MTDGPATSRPTPHPMASDAAERAADAMFALSTPSRVQILWVLREGPLGVGEIVECLGMEQSAVSHQLRVLREHRLIRVERHGRRRVYGLSDEEVGEFLDAVQRHISPQPSAAGRLRARPDGQRLA